MVEGESVVKWLYPGAEDSSELQQVSDMESELQTDQSVHGSEIDKSSPTSSGTDLDTFSSEDLPQDSADPIAEIGQKVTAASSYVGSLLSSSWYSGPKEKETKPAASSSSTASNTFSSAFFSTIGKVSGSQTGTGEKEEAKNDEDKPEEAAKDKDAKESSVGSGFGYLTNAFSKIGISGLTGSTSADLLEGGEEKGEKAESEEKGEKENSEEKADEGYFSSAFSKVGKAASTYTKVIQDTVYKAPLLSEFNQEQENFIKSKGDKDIPTAPWSGYQNEEELKEKILALSLDQRNFLRAPPSGVEFDMESAAVSTHAIVLLKEDKRLEKIRYQLVPKQIKEEDFWKNYFYRVGVIQQSFELNNIPVIPKEKKDKVDAKKNVEDEIEGAVQPDHDDEFVSDSHQVSSKDLAEADEAMKKLGLAKEDAEWEAELEGELEYEMVQGAGDQEENQEWEEQIQELLDAEEGK